MNRYKCMALIFFVLVFSSFVSAEIKTGDLPNVSTSKKLRDIVGEYNEAAIAKSFVDADPAFVLGSVVNTKTGEVQWETFLKSDAEPKIEVKTELWERKLLEKDLAASVSYLAFISGSLSDKKMAEVTLIKNSVTSAKRSDIDFKGVEAKLKSIPGGEIDNYGLIIQYTDFILTASLFEEVEKKAEAKGYGAKISGKWHNKVDNKDMDRIVVATYYPLKSVLKVINKMKPGETVIEQLKMQPLEQMPSSLKSIEILESAKKSGQ